MKTSIIILTFNGLELNRKCVAALLANTRGDFELVIVDNASTDGTVEYLEAQTDPRLHIIFNDRNAGFAAGCNQGARAATGAVLVFLNNDTEVTPGWLEPLLEALAEPGTGIAGSRLLFADGTIQHAGLAVSRDGIPRHIYRGFPAGWPAANKPREFQAVTGACLAIRKELFDSAGGFDESYENGIEDIDLCFRVRRLGLKVVYRPESVVYHLECASKNRLGGVFRNLGLYRSRWPAVTPDEDDFYREDGFGRLFIMRQHISNRYLTGNYGAKAKLLLATPLEKLGRRAR